MYSKCINVYVYIICKVYIHVETLMYEQIVQACQYVSLFQNNLLAR